MKLYINQIKDKVKLFSIKNLFSKPEGIEKVNKFYLYCATFFGAGFFKYAPGTFASFIALIIGIIFISFNHIILFTLILILLVLGFISSDKVANQMNDLDPSYIVIDEIVGQLIPFLLIGNSLFSGNFIIIALIFILFRVLDIYKPWIIGRSENHFKGGISIMIDDILAGIFTLFIIFVILMFK